MRTGISITLSDADRRRLESIATNRNASQKHVWRCRIVLLTAQGVGTNAIMAATGKAKTTVWRWQERFMAQGVDGLLRDKTRPPGKPPVPIDRAAKVVAMTLKPPPHEATHWTARAMAKVSGLAVSTVQAIWKAHGLAPHRWRSFKLSNDPAFAEKLHAIVGLYVAPPAHAVVFSLDEKSQIQALDRTVPILPMQEGRIERRSHDYYRHGTSTLFAALDIATGQVTAALKPRHRHQEFLAFLKQIERAYRHVLDDDGQPVELHLVMDNYAAHKHKNVRAWLEENPRFKVHFTPTHASWMNLVEVWFGIVERQAIRRGVFKSVKDLNTKIRAFIDGWNDRAHPFVWTKTADEILNKANRPTTSNPRH